MLIIKVELLLPSLMILLILDAKQTCTLSNITSVDRDIVSKQQKKFQRNIICNFSLLRESNMAKSKLSWQKTENNKNNCLENHTSIKIINNISSIFTWPQYKPSRSKMITLSHRFQKRFLTLNSSITKEAAEIGKGIPEPDEVIIQNVIIDKYTNLFIDHKKIDRFIFVTLYGIELVAIVVTNSILLHLMRSPRTKKNFSFAVKAFFTLRSIGDLLSGLVCIPLHLYSSFFTVPHPNKPYKICREAAALWYLEEVGLYISSYTIMSIALARFMAIMMPFSTHTRGSNKCQTIWGVIFVLVISLTLPITFLIVKLFYTTGYTCDYSPRQFKAHLTYIILLGMLIPYATSIILYSFIIHKLKLAKSYGGKEGLLGSKVSDDKKDKSIKLIWWLIAIFVICNLPFNCFHFFARANWARLSPLALERILHCMALWFTMIRWLNPLIVIFFGMKIDRQNKWTRTFVGFITKPYSSIRTTTTSTKSTSSKSRKTTKSTNTNERDKQESYDKGLDNMKSEKMDITNLNGQSTNAIITTKVVMENSKL